MSTEPKPATGEWTLESLYAITKDAKGPVEEWELIAKAHKEVLDAAIAEAKHKFDEEITEQREAERENLEEACRVNKESQERAKEWFAQLVTERNASKAAIAEATKPLVEKITELEGRLSKYEQS